MTWNSESCYTPPPGVGKQIIITDAYPEPVIITDADIEADEAERLAEEAEQGAGPCSG